MERYLKIRERLNNKLKKFPKNYEQGFNDGINTAKDVVSEFQKRYALKLETWHKSNFAYDVLQENLSKMLVKHPTNKEQAFNNGLLTAKSVVKDVFEMMD